MAAQRMVDLGDRLVAIGMQDLFDLQDAEDRKLFADRLRRIAPTKDKAQRKRLLEIAASLD